MSPKTRNLVLAACCLAATVGAPLRADPRRIDDGGGDPGGGCVPDFIVEKNGQAEFTLSTQEDPRRWGWDGFRVRLPFPPQWPNTVTIHVWTTSDEVGINLFEDIAWTGLSYRDITLTQWDAATGRDVVVSGNEDSIVDGDQPFEVYVRNLSRQDPNCDPVVTIHGVNRDNEFVALDVTVRNLRTDAAGGTATTQIRPMCNYTGCLPSSSLTVRATVTDTAQGLVKGTNDLGFSAASQLVFSGANLQIYQTLNVQGQDDSRADGDNAHAVLLRTESTDTRWNGLSVTVNVTNEGPTDRTACVPAVGQSFLAFSGSGPRLALRDYGFPSGEYFGGLTSLSSHFQGVQRGRRGSYLFLSGTGDNAADLFSAYVNKPGVLGAWGTNMDPGPNEAVVWHGIVDERRDSYWGQIIYSHVGGIGTFGDFLVAPLEKTNGYAPEYPGSLVRFYNVFSPSAPVRLGEAVERPGLPKAGAATVIKIPTGFFTGKYLLAVEADSPREIQFYLSNHGNIRGPEPVFPTDYWAVSTETLGVPNYNNISFVEQCDGGIFMIATYNSGGWTGGGANIAHLYRVTPPARLPNGTTSPPNLDLAASRVFDCEDGHWCNFSAAAGASVSPNGALLLYSTHYWRNLKDGWLNFDDGDGILRIKEFN